MLVDYDLSFHHEISASLIIIRSFLSVRLVVRLFGPVLNKATILYYPSIEFPQPDVCNGILKHDALNFPACSTKPSLDYFHQL